MAFSPITSWQIHGEKLEIVTDFIFLGSKTQQMVSAATKLKDMLLGRKVMSNLGSIFKSRDITLPTKVSLIRL